MDKTEQKTEQATKTPGLDSTSAAPDSGADAAASANRTADSKGTMPNIAAGNAAQDDKTGSTTHGNKTAGAAHVNKTAGAALESKLKKLGSILDGYGKMTVALSGGVDSAFLLCFAYKTWHDNRIAALTACGPHFAPDETEYSAALCSTLGISHELIPVDHILPLIEDNPVDRCYVCKKAIFSSIKKLTDEQGRVLADGTNLDDMSDYRPGHKALQELKVASPLKEAGLTKQEIRTALHQLAESDPLIKQALTVPSPGGSIPMWEKPAFACLASRIPYGEQITREKLAAVYKAESYLRSLGFTQLRVRHHGNVARIEVLPEDRSRFYDEAFMDMVNEEIKKCGFKFAALDLCGYRMGSLNG